MRSSVTDWLILSRHTALTKSAAPASAKCITVSHGELANPASATVVPHARTAQIATAQATRVLEPSGCQRPGRRRDRGRRVQRPGRPAW